MISSPEKVIFDGELESIIVPAIDGNIQILSEHMPLVATLEEGEVEYEDKKIMITHGVVEVKSGREVIVLVVENV